ncbi:potassium-transporting ATPase subunit B, partial [Adlercreutzia equolifaciens]|nr:potassium-transporting ATPase subunit B [Adlercreutzia equolifaciens]
GKAQADSLRAAKRDVEALLLAEQDLAAAEGEAQGALLRAAAQSVSSSTLAKGQLYLVMAGEQVPADGEIVLGADSVDESAITVESDPVVRESVGDRSSLTG